MENNNCCRRLWSRVFIDADGEVYACCRNQPYSFGNINSQSLRKIWNNAKIRYARKLSLLKGSPCLTSCALFPNSDTSAASILSEASLDRPDYSCLRHIGLAFSYRCNLRCIMCPQNHESRTSLHLENILNNVDFKHVESVKIQGGEPLLIPQVKELFEHLGQRGIKVNLLTNGTLINDDWADKIARYSSTVSISLNAATKKTHEKINIGSHWQTVMRNITKLCKYKKNYEARVVVRGHMTLVKWNLHEIAPFITNYRDWGIEKIDFGFDNSVPLLLKNHPLLKEKIRKSIKSALRSLSMNDIHANNLQRLRLLGLMERHDRKY